MKIAMLCNIQHGNIHHLQILFLSYPSSTSTLWSFCLSRVSSPRASAAFASSRAKVPCCSTPGMAETENPETWWSPKRMEAVEAMISRGSPKFLEGFWNRSPSWKSQLGPEGLNSSQNWASDTPNLVSLGPVISRLGPRAVFDGIFGGLDGDNDKYGHAHCNMVIFHLRPKKEGVVFHVVYQIFQYTR